jgi:peptidyl-tRNA hydrolase, PTH1 family
MYQEGPEKIYFFRTFSVPVGQHMDNQEYLLVGLGNPGEQYRFNRHNIGFHVVDAFAGRFGKPAQIEKWQAEYVAVTLGGRKVHLIKPMTYMNLSGTAVARFSRFFKVPPDHILVVHDDLDMHPGRVKLVKGGGSGGHNGIKSLVDCLAMGEFFRLKIGIGRPGRGDVHPLFPVERYVLSDFTSVEVDLLSQRMPLVVDGIRLFVDQSAEKAMAFLNVLK